MIYQPKHPFVNKSGQIQRARLIAEKALGKFLPKKAVTHHINHIKNDDDPTNLVICENSTYHNLLHRRERALKECGNANWRKCMYCGKYDDPENMYKKPPKNGNVGQTDPHNHRDCFNKRMAEYREKNREKLRISYRKYYRKYQEIILEKNKIRYRAKVNAASSEAK